MNIKPFSLPLPLALMLLLAGGSCSVSEKTQEENNKSISAAVEAKQYLFTARTAQSQGGRTVQLTSQYDLRISNDSVIAFLPYFGRSYSAPIDPAAGGINFTSTDFDYRRTAAKRGWSIEIVPRDASGVRQLFLNIGENGNSTLQVTSNNRQAISFSGRVSPVK